MRPNAFPSTKAAALPNGSPIAVIRSCQPLLPWLHEDGFLTPTTAAAIVGMEESPCYRRSSGRGRLLRGQSRTACGSLRSSVMLDRRAIDNPFPWNTIPVVDNATKVYAAVLGILGCRLERLLNRGDPQEKRRPLRAEGGARSLEQPLRKIFPGIGVREPLPLADEAVLNTC